MTNPKNQFPDFITTEAYAEKGWAGYLQQRAATYHGWHDMDATYVEDKITFEKTPYFILAPALYEDEALGYTCSEILLSDAKSIAQRMEKSTTGGDYVYYDVWGRESIRKELDVQHDFARHLVPVAVRQLQDSPLEKLLHEGDIKNYCMFLNAYFQELRITMQPFADCRAFAFKYGQLAVPTLADGDLPDIKNTGFMSAHIKENAALYSDDAIQERIRDGGIPLNTTYALLKNGISTYETMREALTDENHSLAKLAQKTFGPKNGLASLFKQNQDDVLYTAWKELPAFAPQSKPALELA